MSAQQQFPASVAILIIEILCFVCEHGALVGRQNVFLYAWFLPSSKETQVDDKRMAVKDTVCLGAKVGVCTLI